MDKSIKAYGSISCKQIPCPPRSFDTYISSIVGMKKEIEKAYWNGFFSGDEIEFAACTFEQMGVMLRNTRKEGDKIGKTQGKQEQT